MKEFLIQNLEFVLGAIFFLGIIATKLTPTKTDDKWWGWLMQKLGVNYVRKSLAMAMAIILPVLFLSSCAWYEAAKTGQLPKATGVCVGPTNYVDREGQVVIMEDPMTTTLCKIDPYPSESKLLLFGINDVMLRKGKYEPADVYKFTDDIRGFIKAPGATARSVIVSTLTLIKKSPELFVLGTYLEDPRYQVALPIDAFTEYFLLKHLNEQDMLARMFE